LRHVLKKALEPIELVFKQIPAACGLEDFDLKLKNSRHLDQLVEILNDAFGDLTDAPKRLRSKAEVSLLEAFDSSTIATLRTTIRNEYVPHRLLLSEYRLRSFVDRAAETELSDEAWLDGMASLLTGKRLDAWQDDTADTFSFEAKALAARLSRWLAHMREQVASHAKLVTVHVVNTSGQERMVVVRPGSLAKDSAAKVAEIHKILAGSKDPGSVLAHVMASGMSATSPKERADG
jgi:hypothetical protein